MRVCPIFLLDLYKSWSDTPWEIRGDEWKSYGKYYGTPTSRKKVFRFLEKILNQTMNWLRNPYLVEYPQSVLAVYLNFDVKVLIEQASGNV